LIDIISYHKGSEVSIVKAPYADMIATVLESLWMTLNCKLDFTPVMELSDLQKGLQNVK
jgi:hypothetical protein